MKFKVDALGAIGQVEPTRVSVQFTKLPRDFLNRLSSMEDIVS